MAVQAQRFNQFSDAFANMPWLRQVVLLVALAGSIAMGVGVVVWSQTPDYVPLAIPSNAKESVQIVNALKSADIKVKLNNQGAILVPAEKLQVARMGLAEKGLPRGPGEGYELLDEGGGFGTSQFMENARYQRSIEGELARTITSLKNITVARVHLAIPKAAVFVRDQQEPSASVFVDVLKGDSLKKSEVASIVHLIASSVPNLKSKDVTVIDQYGNLLTESDSNDQFGLTVKEIQYERELEQHYSKKIEQIITPIVGLGRVRAQVSVDMDFTQSSQTSEKFNPNPKAIVSEQTSSERDANSSAGGAVGALSGGAESGADTSGTIRSNQTKNYNLDRTVSYVKNSVGDINRLTIAVIIDNKSSVNAEGVTESTPLSEEEIKNIEKIVKDAIGFNAERGDSINVINTAFVAQEIATAGEGQAFYEQAWFKSTLKQGAGVLFIIFLLLFVLRPILKSLLPKAPKAEELAAALPGGDAPAIGHSGGAEANLENATPEEQLILLKEIVQSSPGAAALVVKDWLAKN